MLNVESIELSLSSSTCQNQFHPSKTLNTFARWKVWKNVFYCWKWIMTFLSALFRSLGSMKILILFGLTTIKQLETQMVGSLTCVIMFIFCNMSSSAFNCAFNAMGTFLSGCTTGCTFSSWTRWYFSSRRPPPSKSSGYSSNNCFLLRGVVDSCLTSRMFSSLQFRSSMCCRDLFPISGMQSSLITGFFFPMHQLWRLLINVVAYCFKVVCYTQVTSLVVRWTFFFFSLMWFSTEFAQYFESIWVFTFFCFEIGFAFADVVNIFSIIACKGVAIQYADPCLVISAALEMSLHLSKGSSGVLNNRSLSCEPINPQRILSLTNESTISP